MICNVGLKAKCEAPDCTKYYAVDTNSSIHLINVIKANNWFCLYDALEEAWHTWCPDCAPYLLEKLCKN